ncbi:ABC1 domain protein [Synechococcus sp. JA-2-3B'a(2-13)]|uniref:ABC1 kinase family protein n=1 Tax=Synechococcus sp. (strain JA-2-3B'a(2-13)) TaxID=321332 RepID=UPI0000694D6C|nr:AarF/ABC1/UbiB kinase family protein [Synechococcus sp. JA-2-3B'a(2-13)]ABD02043.1 ABC1 domain protein [Synechococcus sp. JA-2-3B'a(2-13)]
MFSRTSPIAALEVYDPQLICRYYRWRLPQVIGRALAILWPFLWFVLCLRWDQLWGHTDRNVGRRSVQLRKLLTDLGPTFIKVGQALSTRPDLVRKDYLEELTQLQDQLPPFPSEQAFARIESELGRPIAEIFAQISPEPVAAASLGQVYKAQLHSGEWVAVKVQRPHLREQLSLDLYLIRWASTWLGPWLPLNLGSTLTAVVDEFGRKLFEEIDYLHEGRNCERFAEYFRDDPDVYVPRIFWAYSTRRVLTLEWIDGIKLTDVERIRAANLEVKQLVRIGVVAALKQLLEYGFFHADPHPGNLFALTDGRMAYIDFGMMDQLTEEMKEYLVDALVHLVDRDYNALIDDFIHLGFLQPDVGRQELIPALEKVLADVLTQEVVNFNFKTATDQFSDLMYRYPFQVPSHFALVIRSLVTQEGVALSLYPQFRIVGVAYPYVAKRLLTDESPRIRQRLLQVLIKDGKFRWNRLENLIQIARSDGGLDWLPTAQTGLRYLMSEEARDLRRQLVLSLTEDDRLHFEELQRLWQLLSPELSPAYLWQATLRSLPSTGDLQHTLVELREQVQAHLEHLSRWRLPQPWSDLLAGVGQER